LRHNFVPRFQQDYEAELIRQIMQFGISPFALNTLEKWLKGRDVLPLLNSVLTYAANNGTYYIQGLASVLRNAMARHPTVVPVVEAFVLTLESTPLKKALDAEFRAVSSSS
jgi:hypothetical protein